MYGLSTDVDLSFFINKLLLQVCIGNNEAILHFDNDVSITIHTDISHRHGTVETALYKSIPSSAAMLVAFIHESVQATAVEPPGTLVLTFSNQESIVLYDISDQYESYEIYSGTTSIIV